MHYRWNYNEDWAYQEFGAISAPDRPAPEQYGIGKRNGERFKGALPPLGVSPTSAPAIEQRLLLIHIRRCRRRGYVRVPFSHLHLYSLIAS